VVWQEPAWWCGWFHPCRGLWYTPSFDAQGNIYLGVANLASNGSTTFAAVNDFALEAGPSGFTGSVASQIQALCSRR
jgi:hypothetical protein